MKEERYHLVLDDFEQGVVIRALNDLRTDLISNKRETDAVDEVLLKVCKAPTKKMKVVKTANAIIATVTNSIKIGVFINIPPSTWFITVIL